jgi:tight adherence protein B
MNETGFLIAVTLAVTVSAALLAWFVIDVGTVSLTKYRAQFTERAKFQAREFFLFIDPKILFTANLLVMSVGAAVAWAVTGSVLAAVPVFFALALVPRFVYAALRKRRLHHFETQLPDALMMIAGGMRAGSSLVAAVQQLVVEAPEPLSQEFSLMLREQRLGVSLEQSLNNLARRMPTQTTTLVVSAMRIASDTGGGLAETLERTAETIRSRLQLEGKIDALTSQGKMQAWVVGSLPLLLMVVLNKMDPESMGMLWHTPMGWATLAVIALLEIMGVYLIRKITSIDV